MSIKERYETYIDGQFRRPTGVVGRIIGGRMAQQHEPENEWTVSLLSVQPTDHILEIGFGPGTTIQRLAALASKGQVAGIDFSPTMVRVARKRNAAAIKSGRVNLTYGNAANLPYSENSFDKALSIHALYFWPDALQTLQEIRCVLKPGGMLVLTLLPREKWPGDGKGTPECRVYSADDVVKLMLEAGFLNAHVAQTPANARFRELAVIGVK
ncbi:MAG TPA: class I SAM-dependent methyltransferase [Ktedonobacteraceae bacterium]|nr:class I SAM-dependent methyltransferase [Ktedonobacteraceae bacterium]